MNRTIAIVLAGLGILLAGCGRSGPAVEGAWVLLGTTDQVAAGAAEPNPEESLVKILTPTHFAFGARNAEKTVWAGGGTYTLDGDVYTENIVYHSIPAFAGASVTFHCRLEGNRWYHTAQFELGGRSYSINEVWQRIE